MLLMIVGLVLFLAVHSVRIVAEGFRQRFIADKGDNTWKTIYSIASLVGFALIIIGYGQARANPTIIWLPPIWLSHLNVLFMAIAFILLAAAYFPGNRIKRAVGHPMVLGVKVWALGHLLANGELANIVLFGAFLAWAVADFIAARKRDRAQSAVEGMADASSANANAGGILPTALTIGVGLVAWFVFALWLHRWLIGISPFASMG